MKIKLDKKFAEKDIDKFVSDIYNTYSTDPKTKFIFDFTEVEYIGNQELLVFSALLKVFVNSNVDFEVEFFPKGVFLQQVSPRVKKQIIQIWFVWRIFEIVNEKDLIKCFGIDGNSVQRLVDELDYIPKELELYTRQGITPFVPLQFVNNYREAEVQKTIGPIYNLNSVVQQLLVDAKCHHPFTSKALSSIITEELYLNFLDHSTKSSFNGLNNLAAMSISFRNRLDETTHDAERIQKIKSMNFSSECLPESKSFYHDKKHKKFKNIPFIEFSFVDFGAGIANTLRETFNKIYVGRLDQPSDTEILKYAFRYDSSRNPVETADATQKLIPRGLFDAFILVKRYRGLMVVRSNYGKLLYDFSDGSNTTEGVEIKTKENYYFPGTLISIYIPAIEDSAKLNLSAIKPEVNIKTGIRPSRRYISFADVFDRLDFDKAELYNSLIRELRAKLQQNGKSSLIFFDFATTYHIEKRIIKKVLYFLLSDYEINNINNVVIINFVHEPLLLEISEELKELGSAIQNYKIHPLPVTSFDSVSKEVKVIWLGIFDEHDREKLKDLLFNEHSLAKSDFEHPENLTGHIIHFDLYGNLISKLPNSSELTEIYERQKDFMYNKEVRRIFDKHNCIWQESDTLYLCNGNYYRKQYLEVTGLLNHPTDSQIISRLLFDLIVNKIGDLEEYSFIGVTTTSQKLFKSLEIQHLLKRSDYHVLDSHHILYDQDGMPPIKKGGKYILICDVIATGSLTQKLYDKLSELGAELAWVGVLVNTLTYNEINENAFIKSFQPKIISLYDYGIKRYLKGEIKAELQVKKIVRVNPFTNIPITLSVNETYYKDSVIFASQISYDQLTNSINVQNDFLSELDADDIYVGFLKFNSLIHPYFFNTDNILANVSEDLLYRLFKRINKPALSLEPIKIFYPRKSGIEFFDIDKLKNVLANHDIEEIQIERFGTPEGWRFPHNNNYLSTRVDNKTCFILDDGSCSGDSLIQMIDEIAFYNVKEIILLCFIGRVGDHKREFFSRLSSLKVRENTIVGTSIFFVSHWHLPTYYIDENPNLHEKQWLSEVIALPNTPLSIKRIAKNVLGQITPKSKAEFIDYKYLPKIRSTSNLKIPKKDLLMIREELGKVIGFRLYSESFTFFDFFFKKYETEFTGQDHYKEMELLCASFIYEPYLYKKLKSVLPDIAEQIERFVKSLIFSNDDSFGKLTYEWDKTDIIHLFFVVFKNQHIVTHLSTEDFRALVKFTYPKHSALNYILYKLLYYFPINADELPDKILNLKLKELILKLTSDNGVPKKEIKKFYTFIASLPSREDFESQMAYLRDNYIRQEGAELHDLKAAFGHNVSLLITNIRQQKDQLETEGKIDEKMWNENRDAWFEINSFISPILSFSKSFNGFLKPYPYFSKLKKFEGGENSIRGLVGYNNEIFFMPAENLKEIETLDKLEVNMIMIQREIEVNSAFHQLIENPKSDLKNFINDILAGLAGIGKVVVIQETISLEGLIFGIPKDYTDILLTKELVNNVKNHSAKGENTNVELTVSIKSKSYISVKIANEISHSSFEKSNGEGLKCLNLLAEFVPFGFSYSSETVDSKFIQTLTFKTQ